MMQGDVSHRREKGEARASPVYAGQERVTSPRGNAFPHRSIVLIGNYGATNVGDEAVLSGLLRLLHEKYPDATVTVLSYDPAHTAREHGCSTAALLPFGLRSFFRFGWPNTLEVLWKAEEVYVGGGALFTDERIFALFLWGYHVLAARLLCGRVGLIANTIGPLRTVLGKTMMKWTLHLVRSVSVRDEGSLRVLYDLGYRVGVNDLASLRTADPAFLLDPIPNVEREKKITISLRPWKNVPPNFLPTLAHWINERIADGYVFTFLPFQTLHDDDRIVLAALYDLVRDKDAIVFDRTQHPAPLHQTMQWIASSELVVGMRLHSLILSAIQQTPFLALSYSDKVRNFCEDIEMGEWCLDLTQVNEQTLREKSTHIFERVEEIRGHLSQQREMKKEMASKMLSP